MKIDLAIYILMIVISVINIIISIKLLKENSRYHFLKAIQSILYILSAIIVIVFCLINLFQTGWEI